MATAGKHGEPGCTATGASRVTRARHAIAIGGTLVGGTVGAVAGNAFAITRPRAAAGFAIA